MKYILQIWQWFTGIVKGKSLQYLTLYGGATSLGQFFMFVFTLLVARSLGPKQFGFYTSSYAVTGLTIFAINWGMDTWILRESASTNNFTSLAGGILRNKFVLGFAWASFMVICLPIIRKDVFSEELLIVCVVDLWCDSCLNTQIACLNIKRKIRPLSILIIISRMGRLVGAILLISFGYRSAMLFGLMRVISSLSALSVSLAFIHPIFTSMPNFSSIIKNSFPYAASEFLAQIYVQADVTILSLMSTKDLTGLYSTASGMINALFAIPGVGYLLVIPTLSRLTVREPARVTATIQKYLFGFFGLGVILMLGTMVFGAKLIEFILGAPYRESGQLLTIMSPLLLMKSLGYFCAGVLVAVGQQRKRLVPQAASAAVNVLLKNILVIPFAGILGVSVVYIVSEVILTLGYGAAVWKTKR